MEGRPQGGETEDRVFKEKQKIECVITITLKHSNGNLYITINNK